MFLWIMSFFLYASSNDIDYKDELRKVLDTHNHADTYISWKLDEYYPEHKLNDLYKSSLKNKEPQKYCNALADLKSEDQYFLESFLHINKTISDDCYSMVKTTAENYRIKKIYSLNRYAKNNFKKYNSKIKTKSLYIDPRDKKILYDGELSDNHFLLTFDDGPHPTVTPKILSTLKKYNILSQFFIVGQRIQYWPELLKQAHNTGHPVGNHSWSHPDMRKLSLSEAIDQVNSTFNEINQSIQHVEPFFRFPYGAYTFPQLEHLGQNNIISFFWNIDTFDWKIKDPEELLKFSIKKINENSSGIILMHDLHNQTADMLPFLLEYLNSRSAQTVIFKSK